MILPYGLVARIPGFHPGGSGSIPGMGNTAILCDLNELYKPIFLRYRVRQETNPKTKWNFEIHIVDTVRGCSSDGRALA